MNKHELQHRFITYASSILQFIHGIKPISGMEYFRDQLMRSGVSAALNYAESMSAESPRDFVHKLNIALKELRESHTCILILLEPGMVSPSESSSALIQESNELISILVKSVQTTKRKMKDPLL